MLPPDYIQSSTTASGVPELVEDTTVLIQAAVLAASILKTSK